MAPFIIAVESIWWLQMFWCHDIERTCRLGFIDHALTPHFTIAPHVGHRHASLATLLIMVIEIWFNFQIYVQCAEKAISKITFNIRWNLKQIWHSCHTWVSKGNIKGFENNGVWGPDKRDKTGFCSISKDGGKFFCVAIPGLTLCALGWFE